VQRVGGLADRLTDVSESGGNFRAALRGDRAERDGQGDGGEGEDRPGGIRGALSGLKEKLTNALGGGGMHAARVRSRHVDKAGQTRENESVLLRRTFREGGKVRHQRLGNLSHLPSEVVELVERSLRGERFVPAEARGGTRRGRPHGHVAAVLAQAAALGLPALLGPPGRHPERGPGVDRVPGARAGVESWPPWPGGPRDALVRSRRGGRIDRRYRLVGRVERWAGPSAGGVACRGVAATAGSPVAARTTSSGVFVVLSLLVGSAGRASAGRTL
jgi:hypothetical protein